MCYGSVYAGKFVFLTELLCMFGHFCLMCGFIQVFLTRSILHLVLKIRSLGGLNFLYFRKLRRSTVLELFTAFASEVSAIFHPFKVMNNTTSAYILQIVTSGNTYSLWKISAAGCASGLI